MIKTICLLIFKAHRTKEITSRKKALKKGYQVPPLNDQGSSYTHSDIHSKYWDKLGSVRDMTL